MVKGKKFPMSLSTARTLPPVGRNELAPQPFPVLNISDSVLLNFCLSVVRLTQSVALAAIRVVSTALRFARDEIVNGLRGPAITAHLSHAISTWQTQQASG